MRTTMICVKPGYSRESALLSGTNVIPAKAGIHNPVSDGIMDPYLREDDGMDEAYGLYSFLV